MAADSANVFEEMKALYQKLMELRALFPYIPKEMIGQNALKASSIYTNALHKDIELHFDKPLTVEDIRNINEIGGFLNENIIIRLCALLEEHKIFLSETEVDRTIEGHEAANLVKKLRNAFAHSLGRPNAQNPDHRSLFRKLNAFVAKNAQDRGLNPPEMFKIENAEHFPISIDTVIIPLFNGCIKYAEGILKKGPE